MLTFGTLAILHSPPLMHRIPSRLRAILSLCVASAAAEALLFPAGALLFSRVTFAGLVLNFFAIPLMAVAQVAGMAVVPLALVSSTLASGAGYVAHLGAEGLVRSADLVRFAPLVAFRVAPPSWWVVVCYYVALVTLWISRKKYGSAIFAILCLGVFAPGMLLEPRSWPPPAADNPTSCSSTGRGPAFPACRMAHLSLRRCRRSSPHDDDIAHRVVAPVLRAAGIRRPTISS